MFFLKILIFRYPCTEFLIHKEAYIFSGKNLFSKPPSLKNSVEPLKLFNWSPCFFLTTKEKKKQPGKANIFAKQSYPNKVFIFACEI